MPERHLPVFRDFDLLKPHGHMERTSSLFASPNLAGMHRWIAWSEHQEDFHVHQLLVDANLPVYRIQGWEDYLRSYAKRTHAPSQVREDELQEKATAYWSTCTTIRQWQKTYGESAMFSGEWEVVLRPQDIRESTTLHFDTVMKKLPQHLAPMTQERMRVAQSRNSPPPNHMLTQSLKDYLSIANE